MKSVAQVLYRRLRATSALVSFSPSSLFASGEQGVWLDNSDFTALFQDAAGTTPVTGYEQFVGLRLDKRSAAFSQSFNGTSNNITIGSMPDALKLGTGDFTIEFFVKTNGTSVYSICGNLNDDSGSGHYWVILNSSYTGLHTVQFSAASTLYKFGTSALSTGAWHHIAITRSGSNLRCFLNGSQLGATGAISDFTGTYNNFVIGSNTTGAGNRYWLNGNLSNLRIVKGSALYTSSFSVPASALTAVSGTVLLCCGNNTFSSNPSLSYNGVVANGSSPFSAIDGNHAYQTTTTARAVLSARYNLLTQTENFGDAYWSKQNFSINPNGASDKTTAPNGTVTADKVVLASGTAAKAIWRDGISAPCVLTCHIKIDTGVRYIQLLQNGAVATYANFDVTGELTGTRGANVSSSSIVNLGNGWYRLTAVCGGSGTGLWVYAVDSASAGYSPPTSATGAFYIWGADLRVANESSALPVYQRVGAAVSGTSTSIGTPDYDTVGFPAYLRYDGGDWYQTNSINFTATDKMSVFAGVRKLSDAAPGGVLETSTNAVSNAGTFWLFAPGSTGPIVAFDWMTRGATFGGRVTPAANLYPAPGTFILTGTGNISADIATLRVNGVDAGTGTQDQGSGNFGNYPLYIGSRGGTDFFFTGREYETIVLGRAVTATELTNTEGYMETQTFGKDMAYVYSDELTTATGDFITAADGDQIYMSVNYQ